MYELEEVSDFRGKKPTREKNPTLTPASCCQVKLREELIQTELSRDHQQIL